MEENNIGNQAINGSDANTQTPASNNSGYSERERQSYERMKKERERADALEEKLRQYESTNQGNSSDSEWKERIEIMTKHGIKDDDTLDFVMKNGGTKALNNDLVKAAIQKRQEDSDAAQAVAFNTSSKSSVEKRYSQSELRAMSADEYAAAIEGRKI